MTIQTSKHPHVSCKQALGRNLWSILASSCIRCKLQAQRCSSLASRHHPPAGQVRLALLTVWHQAGGHKKQPDGHPLHHGQGGPQRSHAGEWGHGSFPVPPGLAGPARLLRNHAAVLWYVLQPLHGLSQPYIGTWGTCGDRCTSTRGDAPGPRSDRVIAGQSAYRVLSLPHINQTGKLLIKGSPKALCDAGLARRLDVLCCARASPLPQASQVPWRLPSHSMLTCRIHHPLCSPKKAGQPIGGDYLKVPRRQGPYPILTRRHACRLSTSRGG